MSEYNKWAKIAMITRPTRWTVAPENEPLYSNRATTISINDEAGGEFIVIAQAPNQKGGVISFDPCEWPAIRAAIDVAVGLSRND